MEDRILGYNINSEGYITEMGYDPHNEYPYTGNEPFDWGDFAKWRKTDGEWVKITEE